MTLIQNQKLESTRDLTNLDLLRAVAVGLVFISHLLQTMGVRFLGDLGRMSRA
jgi:peptidoglycan/LPS O-acetylase OafA/YrhL